MSLVGWVKGKIADRLGLTVEPGGEGGIRQVSLRFRVPAPGGRTLLVYGRDEAEARGWLPADLAGAALESAGHVEDGVLYCPPDEAQAVTGSIVEGRVAPGA